MTKKNELRAKMTAQIVSGMVNWDKPKVSSGDCQSLAEIAVDLTDAILNIILIEDDEE